MTLHQAIENSTQTFLTTFKKFYDVFSYMSRPLNSISEVFKTHRNCGLCSEKVSCFEVKKCKHFGARDMTQDPTK